MTPQERKDMHRTIGGGFFVGSLRRNNFRSLDITEVTAEPVSSSSYLIFLLLAACHDPQCTIIQRPLQRLRLIGRMHPDVTLLVGNA